MAIVRSPGASSSRRRGPRSSAARARRANQHEPPHGGGLCEARPEPPFGLETLTLLHVNIRGVKSHLAELDCRLRSMPQRPLLVALTETWLDASTASLCLSGYAVVSRLDRSDGRQGGGVALFVASDFADNVVLIAHSEACERSWHILHSSLGPLSFCVWYRPPADELDSIRSFEGSS